MNNKPRSFFGERPLPTFEVDPEVLRRRTRRDALLFGAGAAAVLAGAGSLLPQDTLTRLGLRRNMNSPGKEWLLNRALRIDDDVAETLYSPRRTVPTYTKSQITPLKNNYNGATPDPGYIPGWHLTLAGLASGVSVALEQIAGPGGRKSDKVDSDAMAATGFLVVGPWAWFSYDKVQLRWDVADLQADL